jgi:hypothetical protein
MTFRTLACATILALSLAACADTPPGDGATDLPSDSPIVVPAGAQDLVLRVEFEAGFVPRSYLLTRIPTFSLFGAGTIIVPGAQTEIYPGQALPAITARQVSDEGEQAILRAALDAGLGGDARYTDMGHVMIADAATTVFTLVLGDGQVHRTQVYALGEFGQQERPDGMPADEWEARTTLSRFVQDLGTLDTWLPASTLGEEASYPASSARLLVADYRAEDQLHQQSVDWPLAEGLATFGDDANSIDDLGGLERCGVVGGDDWTAVHELAASANALTPWVSDGTRYGITFRPLLPDETGC